MGDYGSHVVLVRPGARAASGWVAAVPLDWPGGYVFRAGGRLYASLHEALSGWRGSRLVVRDPDTLEPVGLAVVAGRRRLRLELDLLEGEAPAWALLDPYTPESFKPPAAAALEAAVRLGARVVLAVRSSPSGASQGLQALPPGPVVAVAPCRPGEEWPGLAPGLAALRAALRLCVEVADSPSGLPGALQAGGAPELAPQPPA